MKLSDSAAVIGAMLVLGSNIGALAQQSPPPPAAADPALTTDQRLDRIEGKLDDILRLLGARQPTPIGKPGDAPAPPAAAASATATLSDSSGYKAGTIAIVHQAPEFPRDLQQIPADSVGGFVYSGGAIPLHDLKSKGVRFAGLTGLELQGWLKVAAPGRTQIAVEFRGGDPNFGGVSNCAANVWLEGRSIGAQNGEMAFPVPAEKVVDLNFGADLQPGLYRMRLWAVCTPVRDLKLNAEILIKGPSDMNLRPLSADELVHQGG